MEIAQARRKASKIVNEKIIHSPWRRPPKDARVMVRHEGSLILAGDVDTLQEKLAKRIQQRERRKAAATRH